MLKMPLIVCGDPMATRSRHAQKVTTSQTALTGVCVKELILLQKLYFKVNGVFVINAHEGKSGVP